MAPRVGRTTPHRQSYGHSRNGDVPSSTLAAQIADRMVGGHHDPRNDDSESFRLLLRELLEASEPISQPQGNIGDDAAVNSKLVCVIVRAGLGKVQTSPLVDGQLGRAIDSVRSLQAIDLTISRCPGTLFQPLETAFGPGIAPGSPIFAWLIPRILVEVRELKSHDIENHVLSIIKRSLLVEGETETKYGGKFQIAKYIQASITGTFKWLKKSISLTVAEAQQTRSPLLY